MPWCRKSTRDAVADNTCIALWFTEPLMHRHLHDERCNAEKFNTEYSNYANFHAEDVPLCLSAIKLQGSRLRFGSAEPLSANVIATAAP